MNLVIAVSLTLVALAGTAVVLTRQPGRQAVTYSFFGLTLTVLFLVLQAPDVALSQLGVGTAVVPLMVMLAIRTMRAREQRKEGKSRDEGSR
jgi:energy-converting hydrogenase B subunit D